MRRLVTSSGYARLRVVVGLVAAVLGLSILIKTFLAVGLTTSALPAYVLGAAMVALGLVRLRDYRAIGRPRP